MTIAQLIEDLCKTIGELASLVDRLAMRLMQSGVMTEGELTEIKEIRKRIDGIGISPPNEEGK